MKIATGSLRGRLLETPKNADVRPTTEMCRQALFNMCQHYLENATFLDVFAGSGAMGIEAISRGAKTTTFVENNNNCIRCIKNNIEKMGISESCHIFHCDAFEGLKRLAKQKKTFDIIYVDPPYHEKHDKSPSLSFTFIKTYEDLAKTHQPLLNSEGMLFIEDAQEIDFKEFELSALKLVDIRRLGRATLHTFTSAS